MGALRNPLPSYFITSGMRRGDRVVVTGPLHRHLAGALRVRPGERLTLVDGARVLSATVERVTPAEVVAAVTAERPAPPEPLDLTLAVGLPKGRKLEEIVRHAVELGVSRVRPLLTERTIARPDDWAGRAGRLAAIALEAAQQSGRARLPEVAEPCPLADFAAEPCGGLKVALWEGEHSRRLADLVATPADAARLVVGPEGGLSEAEARLLEGHGYHTARLGPHILRTETACLAALAVVALCAAPPAPRAALTAQGEGL
jgi:16S rRNA (uracil1498-N3)-methyltransferase